MVHVEYAVWDDVVHDNRNGGAEGKEPSLEFKGFGFFNEGNPILAFIGDRGFFVLDPQVSLIDALWRHMDRAARESCGKCTPCRIGTVRIRDLLDDVRSGRANGDTWGTIEMLARQMTTTSLCGLGQTAAKALLAALAHFRDELVTKKPRKVHAAPHGMSFVTAPCIEACPSKVDVPRYIDFIKDGKPDHSLGVILQKYPMAATCGRVCVRFCEQACRRNMVDEAVAIKPLKRYVADRHKSPRDVLFAGVVSAPKPADMRVAVVGSGPAGVSCTYHLLLKGYHVDVLDESDEAGGMARVGIPSYRLPKDVLKSETGIIEVLGGRFLWNRRLGVDFTLDDLFDDGYKAIFLGLGCTEGTRIGAEDEDPALDGYASGIDFLLKVHNHAEHGVPMDLDGVVAVVGGGNVAMDCVRSAIRLGAKEVHLIYRRTREEMPADPAEIAAAEEEGVIVHYLATPTRILSSNGKLTGIELTKMRQTVPDKRGRMGVEPIRGSGERFSCDNLIAAIGQRVKPDILKPADGVQMTRAGYVAVTPETLATTRVGVFSGGDCVSGPTAIINAMAQGETAANSIDSYLRHGQVGFSSEQRLRRILSENGFMAHECVERPVASLYRVHVEELDPEVRRKSFAEVEHVISKEEAYQEAKRCMRCYRIYSVITKSPVPTQDD